jgi:hypothetical protein
MEKFCSDKSIKVLMEVFHSYKITIGLYRIFEIIKLKTSIILSILMRHTSQNFFFFPTDRPNFFIFKIHNPNKKKSFA